MFMTKIKTMSAIALALLVAIGLTAFGHTFPAPVTPALSRQEPKADAAKQPDKNRVTDADEQSRQILDKAITAHGGEKALQKLKCLYIKSNLMDVDQEMYINHDEQIKEVIKGSDEMFAFVFNGKEGWYDLNGQVEEFDADDVASVRDDLYVRMVTRLYALKDKGRGFSFSPLKETTVDGEPVVGVRVSSKGKPDVNLFFEKKSSLLVKAEYTSSDGDAVEKLFGDFKELIPGLKLPTKITVRQDDETDTTEIIEMRRSTGMMQKFSPSRNHPSVT